MAQVGRANFTSAFGMKHRKTDRFALMRDTCSESDNKPNIWKTWWLDDISVSATTKTLTDTLSGSGGGSSGNIFIMSE